MAGEQGLFTSAIDQFQRRHGTQVQTDDGITQSPPNTANVQVVRELVNRNRHDVAKQQFPSEYAALYPEETYPVQPGVSAGAFNGQGSNQQTQQNPGLVKIYNRKDDKWSEIDLGADQAGKYNPQGWGVNMRFDATALANEPSDADKQYAEKLTKLVDYSQLGGINGSKNNNGYKFFDNGALLPSLFARKLGMTPEEVLALNHYDREEAARRLLNDYYNQSSPAVRQQIGDVNEWSDTVLKTYGFDIGSQADDGKWDTAYAAGKNLWHGAIDELGNVFQGAKTLLTGAEMTEEERQAAKAEQEQRQLDKSAATKSLAQRFDSLVDDDRYLDALQFLVSNSELLAEVAGTELGSMVADAALTYGGIAGLSAVLAPFTVGGSAAAGTAVATANTARLLNKFKNIAKRTAAAGGISGLGAVGQKTNELLLDGKTIPAGSELHATLAGYGLLNTVLAAAPGTLERGFVDSILPKILPKFGGDRAAAEGVAQNLSDMITSTLTKKGYQITADGISRPKWRSAVEWGGTAVGKTAAETGQELTQATAGNIVGQVANDDGSVDFGKADVGKAVEDARKDAVVAAAFGAAHGAGSVAVGKWNRGNQKDLAVAFAKEEADFKAFEKSIPATERYQLDRDIINGVYNEDGTLRSEDDPLPEDLTQDPQRLQEYHARVREAVLRRKFAESKVESVTPDVDENLNEDNIADLDVTVAADPDEDPDVAWERELNRVRAETDAKISRAGMNAFNAAVSPVKDIRYLNTNTADHQEDVDKLWSDVAAAIKRGIAKSDAQIKTLRDELGKKLGNKEKFANTPYATRDDARIAELEAELATLEPRNKQAKTHLLRARNTGTVKGLLDLYGDFVDNGKKGDVAKAQRLSELLSHADSYMNAFDGVSRFSDRDRDTLIGHLSDIVSSAGVNPDEVSLSNQDLPGSIRRVQAALGNGDNANSRSRRQAAAKADVLAMMVNANRPEMLTNWHNIDKHVRGIKAVKSSAWDGKDQQYSWGRKHIHSVIDTAKVGKEKVFSPDALAFFNDTVDDLYEANPVEMATRIRDRMQLELDAREVDNENQQNTDERRAMLGAIAGMNDVIFDFSSVDNVTRTKQKSSQYGQKKIGNKVFDVTVAKMPLSEVNEYARNFHALKKAIGATTETAFEADMATAVDQLRNAYNTLDALKVDAFLRHKGGAADVLQGKFKDAFRYDVRTYLENMANRINWYKQDDSTRWHSEAPPASLAPLQYGGLIEAVIEQTENPKSEAVNEFYREDRAAKNAATMDVGDPVIDDLITELQTEQPLQPPVEAEAQSTALTIYQGADNQFKRNNGPQTNYGGVVIPVAPNGTALLGHKEPGESDTAAVQRLTLEQYKPQPVKQTKGRIAYEALNNGYYTVDGTQAIVFRAGNINKLYQAAKDAGGNNYTPESVSAFVKEAITDLAETNPAMFSEGTIIRMAEAFADTARIEAWMNKSDKTTKKAKNELNQIIGALNNTLLRDGLAASEQGVNIQQMRRVLADMTLWYNNNGYGSVAALLNQAIGPDTVFNGAFASRNVTVYVVDPSNLPDGVLGQYDRSTNTITLSNQDQDIAKTLVHELTHAVLADVAGNRDLSGLFTADGILNKTDRGKIEAAVKRWASQDSTDADQARAARIIQAGIVDEVEGNYVLTDKGVEELIVLGLDNTMLSPDDVYRQDIDDILTTIWPPSEKHPDRIASRLMTTLARAFDKSIDDKRKTPSVGDHYAKQSPIAQGAVGNDGVRHKRKRDPFKKPANEAKPDDTTYVYHFGFHQDNQQVSSDPMAWWDGDSWTLFYIDAAGNPIRTQGLSYNDVMEMAQGLNLFIEQRERDIMLKREAQRGDTFQQFSPPVAKMWRGINRVLGGNANEVSSFTRKLMSATQRWALNQHGADQFFKFFENTLTHLSGVDNEGVITNRINEARTKINYQLNSFGVNGDRTVYELTHNLQKFMNDIGWSREKLDHTLYAMRAGDYQAMIIDRYTNDPKWKGRPFDATRNYSGFKHPDGTDDPTGVLWMSKLSAEDRKVAAELRKLVTALNDAVIEVEHKSGRISDAQYEEMYGKYYVPLRNESDEATAFQRTGTGRRTKAGSPLDHLIANHQARLRAAEQSMIYQAFMDAMEKHAVKGFATFNSSTLKNKGKGEYAMTADGFLDGTAVTFYRNGQKVNMTITHPEMIAAMKNRTAEQNSAYLDTVAKVTGWLGLVRTAVPTFAKTAYLRDMGMVLMNVEGAFRGQEQFTYRQSTALAAKSFTTMQKAVSMVFKAQKDPENADWRFKMFKREGGIGNHTAYDIDSVNAALETNVFGSNKLSSKAKRGARKYLDILHTSDQAARYGVWMAYLETKHGSPFTSSEQLNKFLVDNPTIATNARNASKNITGNFEQRGMSRRLRSHYIFWNAAQAGIRTIYGMVNPKYGTHGIKSISLLMALVMATGSDEEDEDGKLKEGRMRGLGDVFTIPGLDIDISLAQELRPFVHLAQSIKYYVRGDWDMGKSLDHFLKGAKQALVPFTDADTDDTLTNAIYALTPTLVQPMLLQAAGKNFFGGDIAPDPYDNEGKKWIDAPDYVRTTSGTSDTSQWVAEKLYTLTGGAVDVAPNSLDMWAQLGLGSLLTIGKHYVNAIEKGEDPITATVSLVAKGHVREYNIYALKDETTSRLKKAMQSFRISDEGEILGEKSWPAEYQELKDIEKSMRKELDALTGPDGESKMSDLQQRIKQLKHSDSATPDELLRLTHEMDVISQARNYVYGKYNRMLLDMGYF